MISFRNVELRCFCLDALATLEIGFAKLILGEDESGQETDAGYVPGLVGGLWEGNKFVVEADERWIFCVS